MNNVKIKEGSIKPIETKLNIENTNMDLKTLDTNIIIDKLEANLKTRLTSQDMFEILK